MKYSMLLILLLSIFPTIVLSSPSTEQARIELFTLINSPHRNTEIKELIKKYNFSNPSHEALEKSINIKKKFEAEVSCFSSQCPTLTHLLLNPFEQNNLIQFTKIAPTYLGFNATHDLIITLFFMYNPHFLNIQKIVHHKLKYKNESSIAEDLNDGLHPNWLVNELGETGLMDAIDHECWTTIQRFLSYPDIDVNTPDAIGRTPLLMAAKHLNFWLAFQLFNIESLNPNSTLHGGNALHFALQEAIDDRSVEDKALRFVKLFSLRFPLFNLEQKNKEGHTVFDLAKEANWPEMESLLSTWRHAQNHASKNLKIER